MIKINFCLYWYKTKSQLIISTKRQNTNHWFQIDRISLFMASTSNSTYIMTTGVLVWAIVFGWSLFASEIQTYIRNPSSHLSVSSRDFIRRTLRWNFPATFRSHLRLNRSLIYGKILLIIRQILSNRPGYVVLTSTIVTNRANVNRNFIVGAEFLEKASSHTHGET